MTFCDAQGEGNTAAIDIHFCTARTGSSCFRANYPERVCETQRPFTPSVLGVSEQKPNQGTDVPSFKFFVPFCDELLHSISDGFATGYSCQGWRFRRDTQHPVKRKKEKRPPWWVLALGWVCPWTIPVPSRQPTLSASVRSGRDGNKTKTCETLSRTRAYMQCRHLLVSQLCSTWRYGSLNIPWFCKR
jgi:hypothetical protein